MDVNIQLDNLVCYISRVWVVIVTDIREQVIINERNRSPVSEIFLQVNGSRFGNTAKLIEKNKYCYASISVKNQIYCL